MVVTFHSVETVVRAASESSLRPACNQVWSILNMSRAWIGVSGADHRQPGETLASSGGKGE